MKTHRLCTLFSLLSLLSSLCCQKCVTAQEVLPRTAESIRPLYNIVAYDEDWSYLYDRTLRSDWLDGIKYIQFGENARSYVSIGGEFRGTYERVLNDNWSNRPVATNSFGLQRFLLHTDVHFNSHVRTFLELQSGLEQGRPDGPRPVDKKRLDFLNAFLDLRPSASERSPTLRLGKQELQLGSGRLISVREGTNVRQAFYGFRADQRIANWDFTGFAVRPAIDRPGFFNGGPLGGTSLWGVLGNRKWNRYESFSANGYYYGLDRKSATYNRGTAHEVRQTVGVNFVANPPDTTDRPIGLHLDVEGMYQTGTFGSAAIRAWSIATETGVSLSRLPRSPRLGLRADISSGDKGGRSTLGTFNPLFPAGNYFGVLADTGPGPLNFRDLHPKFILPLPHAITLTPDWIFWWRQQLEDGVYSVPGTLIVPAGRSTARYVGHRPGMEARWQIDRHAYMQLSYGVFFAGPFLKQSGHSQNLNYLSYGFGCKF